MCSRSHRPAPLARAIVSLAVLHGCAERPQQKVETQRVLRVCADPNNLPFSNEKQEGFENRIADIVARDLGARVEYTWFAQRRGFIRNTLRAGLCDIVMGVPSSFELAATTRPYYRSTYVFVTRADTDLRIGSLDDAVLSRIRIGVHTIGDDYTNPPPLHALARRNIIQNVSGYSIFGDYSQPNPPAKLLNAVAEGEVDVAIVWGPFAGYFAKQQPVPLRIEPVQPEIDLPFLPFVYDISMGVRRGEEEFREEIERVMDRQEAEIDNVLAAYAIPMKPVSRGTAGAIGR